MKANDNIPADEMALAEAIAAVKAAGIRWCAGRRWAADPDGYNEGTTHACAVGALELAGYAVALGSGPYGDAWRGNDITATWEAYRRDLGESLGWAYRLAMTQ